MRDARRTTAFSRPGYAPLVTPAQVTGETQPGEKSRFGGKLDFLDAHPGSQRCRVRIGSGAAGRAPRPGLYESEAGWLRSW